LTLRADGTYSTLSHNSDRFQACKRADATGRVRLLAVSLYGGRSITGLFKDTNPSTPIHESGHEWPDELVTDASEEVAWA